MFENIITLENVFYSYPRVKTWALENINLTIAEGEFLAVMGENGAGKTTLCKLFNGIIPLSSGGRLLGTVTVDGVNTKESKVAQLAIKVGMALDDPDAQLFTTSVRHEAAFGPENLLLPPQEIEKRVGHALAMVGLANFEQRAPATLSGGEKQRMAIAAALAMAGKILVLDEPLSRLDPSGAEDFLSVIKDIRRKQPLTVIMATHDSEKAAEFADRVCILKNGRIAACDTAQNIFADSDLLRDNGIQPPGEARISDFFTTEEEEFTTNQHRTIGSQPTRTTKDSEVIVPQVRIRGVSVVRGLNDFGINTKPPAIEIAGFGYSYDQTDACIENINLSMADNDFVAITGRNGSGKTTLLKNITGLLRPCAGEIYIRGKNSNGLSVPQISKEIGFVMQNPDNQLFTGTVYNEVSFALKNTGLPKAEIRRRAEEALAAVGLEEPDAFPPALSRADRTKTVIASVFAMGSKIIILDEVDVGQDYRGSRNIMDIAAKLHAQGCTIIFVTHNMSLVCEYSQRLVVMGGKGIVIDGKTREVFSVMMSKA